MGKTKGSAGGDFKKKKQKLGKKKLAPTNATNTTVKVKTIALPEQSQTVAKSGLTTHRNLTMTELLAQLKHYNPDVRSDALGGLYELLLREANPSQALRHVCASLFCSCWTRLTAHAPSAHSAPSEPYANT